MKRKTSW